MYVHVNAEFTKLAFVILRRLFPFSPDPKRPPLQTLNHQYRKWQGYCLLLFLLFMPAMVFGWYVLFDRLAQWVIAQQHGSVFFIMLERPWFLLPSIFLGIVTCVFPMQFSLRLFLQSRYDEYTYYVNLQNGFDAEKSFYLCATLMLTGLMAITVLMANQYTRFTAQSMDIKHVWAWHEKSYPYSQVAWIHYLSHTNDTSGQSNNDPQYRVCFNDGTLWRFENYQEVDSPADQALEKRMIDYVATQSQRPIESVDDPKASPYDTHCTF